MSRRHRRASPRRGGPGAFTRSSLGEPQEARVPPGLEEAEEQEEAQRDRPPGERDDVPPGGNDSWPALEEPAESARDDQEVQDRQSRMSHLLRVDVRVEDRANVLARGIDHEQARAF